MITDDQRGGPPPLRAWVKRLVRLVGGEPQSREQLLDLLAEAKRRAVLDVDSLSMIEGVLQVSELRVRDIMIPRAQMVVVRRSDPFDRILPVVLASAHSRFPVIADDRGEVLGLLLAKDLLASCGSDDDRRRFNVRDILRPAVYVPDSKRLNVLLKEFRTSRNHMAIVVDEYGNAAGLITIEDVLEQIVGEIEDEHDYDESAPIFKRSESEYTLKAVTPIDEFNEFFGASLPADELDTIGGLVIRSLGHVPKRGETVDIGPFRFKVMRADSRRVHLLGLRLLPPAEPPAPAS
jgi:magnesium and cobalt transporter